SQSPFGFAGTAQPQPFSPSTSQPARYGAALSAPPYERPQVAKPAPRSSGSSSRLLFWAIGGIGLGGVALVLLLLMLAVMRLRNNLSTDVALRARDEDYAVARAQFHTQLTRQAGSPQAYDPHRVPPDGQALPYMVDGRRQVAMVDQPPTPITHKRPAVIFLHGGFAYGDEDWEMPQQFRDAGFMVAIPILRGENGQGGSFSLYYDEVNDVLAVADMLARQPYIDGDNLFVCGHSAGGSLAALAALAGSRFRAAASFGGAMDQRIMLPDRELMVFDPLDIEEIQMRSPVAFAHSFKCPTRLYYGHEETWLKPQCETTVARAAGHQVVTAKEVRGDHFTAVPGAINDCVSFFREHLTASGRAALNNRSSNAIAGMARTQPNTMPESFAGDSTLDEQMDQRHAESLARHRQRMDEMRKRHEELAAQLNGAGRPPLPTPNFPGPPGMPGGPGFPPTASSGGMVVRFQVLDYHGAEPAMTALKQACVGIAWVDRARIDYDESNRLIEVGVQGGFVNTSELSNRLRVAGFNLGTTQITR
ncbi:MAG: alpha/beta fold hydrolase, partial [Planctomycetales bacterium]|nr:alpha/beta fold hydrolase [Planctomycetales bacterium]